MVKEFTLQYWQEDKWVVGRIVEFPGLFSQGKSLDELEANLYDAYYLMIDEGVPPEDVEVEEKLFEIEIDE